MNRSSARFVWMSILPVGISLISFVFSLYGIISAREAPDVVMTMPIKVRISQSGTTPWLYIQPRFVNTGDNNRNEIIQTLRVEITASGSDTPTPFIWDEEGAWLYNPQTFKLNWQFVADPTPLVVGPNDPQFPLGLFIGPDVAPWRAGTYRVTMIADRIVESAPLRASVDFTLTDDLIEIVSDPNLYLVEVPTTPVS